MKQTGNKIQVKEILKFLAGGTSAVLTDYAVYRILLAAGFAMSPAKAVSYVCGAVVGFVINKFWTFESRRFSKSEIIRYAVLYLCSACANAVVNKAVVMAVAIRSVAFLCATGVSTVVNFLGQKFFVFVRED